MFKILAGWEQGVAGPYSCTERGQIQRIRQLNGQSPYSELGGFGYWLFGGRERVDQVRDLLVTLQRQDTEVIVCTKGLAGAVRKCLADLDLLKFFSEVYGNTDDGVYPKTDYDESVIRVAPDTEETMYCRVDGGADWNTKASLILQLVDMINLDRSQVVLVEDDPAEEQSAIDIGIQAVLVEQREGLTLRHMNALRSMTLPKKAWPREKDECSADGLPMRGKAKFAGKRHDKVAHPHYIDVGDPQPDYINGGDKWKGRRTSYNNR